MPNPSRVPSVVVIVKRRTKIVCTLGPAVNSRSKVKELIQAGMNVARLNCSHGDWETRAQWIDWIRELSTDRSPVAILADLQGPKFRLGALADGELDLKAGQTVTIGADPGSQLPVPYPVVTEAMDVGDRVLLGDGYVELKLQSEPTPKTFVAKVITSGLVRSKQGVTLVGKVFDSPPLTPKDREDAVEAMKLNVDIIALSYVGKASDMEELRAMTRAHGSSVLLCAKVETRQAVKRIDEIIAASDVIMVARGDMGLQMEIEEVPIAQKQIIAACLAAGKPVITATQMLESMMQNARPTRAEATDVANAIFDGTDAVMLSGETASGNYPIESVRTMADIAEHSDSAPDHLAKGPRAQTLREPTSSVAQAAVQLAHNLGAKAIITTSSSGFTARMVSKFRPRCPILCAAWSDTTHRQLAVSWGVETVRLPLPETTDEVVAQAITEFQRQKMLKSGDLIVVTAGVPAGQTGHTNLIWVETVH